MTLLIVYLLIAILVSFLCSVLEAVLLSSTSSYIESLAKKSESNAIGILRELKSNIDKPISSILILNTFAHTMGAAGVGAQAQNLFGEEWQTLIAFVLTLMILYFSEIIPKTIGAIYWKKLLIPSAYIISFLIKVSYPLVWISTFITDYISKNKENKNNVSRDEIMAIVAMGEKEGSILSKESNLIANLFRLKNVKAKDVMTPRSVVFALDENTTIKDAVDSDKIYIFSRIPVYKDTIDDIVGIVLNQAILEESIEDRDDKKVKDIAMDVYKVSENIPVSNLIDLFVKRKTHLFVVYDGYGQTSGIVTLEDVIEALLGVEIVDEMDEVEDMQVFAKNRNRVVQGKMMVQERKYKSKK
ncbi:transporter [Malaciobacter halophilus]|uniref:Transporter n=1 Tax=Malaciobacter halophilus TaxID=197482 RepID=A0A2N1J5G2_9BACT|nr:hemolysin family protein [Malaciobacter halophilus]AXH10780.1 HlyC/CorC family transporter [Malaciobacter halophilus]PKI81799.1 transporter [Malaciobacter halophilus]